MTATSAEQILRNIQIPPGERHVSVQAAEGEFMHRWVKEHGLSRTLEIGLAFGTSAAYIASAHTGKHTCIDPYQDRFNNQGLRNLETVGIRERLEFHPGFSHDVLPQLLAQNHTYDFAFIDGAHLYDAILVDFYFVDRLLSPGGYVIFHDGWMRGTQLVVSFIKRNRRDYRAIRCPIRNLSLFQKVGEDDRAWYHFREFYTGKGFFSHRLVVWLMKLGILNRLLGFFSRNQPH